MLDDLARRFGDGAHSIFAPSSSAMWLHCAGSLIPNLLAPDTAGEDAAYGTVMHSVTEEWLRTGARPEYLRGQTWTAEAGGTTYSFAIDDEMLEYAHDCVRWVEELPKPWHIEQKVDFSHLTPVPRQRGTADFIAWEGATLHVRDWKFGKGVQVFAKENPQGMLYATGAILKIEKVLGEPKRFQRIVIGIAQPRLDHFDLWECSRDELKVFGQRVRERAALAWQENAPRTPGEKACRFCKVRPTCGAMAEQTAALVDATFDDLADKEPRRPADMTTAELARVKGWRKTVEAWLADVDEELLRRANAGEAIPGWKLAEGRGAYDWADTRRTEDVLRRLGVPEAEMFTREFLSPNAARGVLKARGVGGKVQKGLLGVLTRRVPGKPTLVREEDTRPALTPPNADGVFDDLRQNGEDL